MIEFNNVWKTYTKELFHPPSSAIQGLSFTVGKGETLGLIGANGAGKSTCIRLLLNFIFPDRGNITIFNTSPSAFLKRKKIGYLPEVPNLPANLNILDLLKFTGCCCGLPPQKTAVRGEELLQELLLWEARKAPIRTYSKGMQQRAGFALALINDPDLFILDEPMSGLDPLGRHAILSLIQQLKQNGKTLLFCSHILEDVDKIVDNVLLLHKGKPVFWGAPVELAAAYGASNIAEGFVSAVNVVNNDG